MNNVKYKAWVKYPKYFKEVLSIDFMNKKIYIEANKKNKPFGYIYIDDCELLQYTGLEDSNGKEICEGDIVEVEDHKYKICYEIGSFMLVRLEQIDMSKQFQDCWNDDVYPLSQLYRNYDCEENILDNCKILGNIYENPELLED